MVNDFVQVLIDILTDFKTFGPATKLGWIVGVSALVLTPIYALRRWLLASQTKYAREAAESKQALLASEKSVAELSKQVKEIQAHDADTLLDQLKVDRRDGNYAPMIAHAQDYLEHHRAAFAETCTVLSQHYMTRFEDGADALELARCTAMGAIAAAPQDKSHQSLLDEIDALIAIDRAQPENEVQETLRQEQALLHKRLAETPGDIDALMDIGNREFHKGRYRNALAFYRRAESELTHTNGPGRQSETGFSVRNSVGEALFFGGRINDAVNVLSSLLPQSEEVMGPEHSCTLSIRFELARALGAQGNHADAEARLKALLPVSEKVIGAKHNNVLVTRFELAVALMDQGKSSEADELLTDLLPIQEHVNGKEHPHTLVTRHTLAGILLDQGEFAEAKTRLESLLSLEERVNGPLHHYTLRTRALLGCALLYMGLAADAEAHFRELLPLDDQVRGPKHPDTMRSRCLFVRALLEQGKAEEARDAFNAIKTHESPIGSDSAKLRMLSAWLADFSGDAAAADAFLEEAETLLADLKPQHHLHRELARYRETRVPGKPGGTMVWSAEGDSA